MLRELKAKWVLTINDHPLLKRLYKGFHACSYFTSPRRSRKTILESSLTT